MSTQPQPQQQQQDEQIGRRAFFAGRPVTACANDAQVRGWQQAAQDARRIIVQEWRAAEEAAQSNKGKCYDKQHTCYRVGIVPVEVVEM
jgi:hypothetical protein